MLKLSGDLSLADDAITQTFAILAVRGAGKSNLATVMAEEMFAAHLPFVVVDPVGAWWGLRSSGDGKSAGIPIPIFGGLHGDVPLERAAGAMIADLIVDNRLSCILDVSEFSEGDKIRFLCDFAERLYRRNSEPLHLFLEEADDYVPQRPMREQARLLRAFENIVRRGRARGLGITMISQRSAAINKNVLTQIETLFVLRTTSPQDRKAIAAWVEYNAQDRELLASLPGLGNGEAWVWSPQWLKTIERIQVRRRWTFDSGATPKQAKASRKPATLADVDLAAIGQRMSDAIERAKSEDPKELRAEISRLRSQIKQAQAAAPQREVQRVEVKIITDEQLRKLDHSLDNIKSMAESLSVTFGVMNKSLVEAYQPIINALRSYRSEAHRPAPVNARPARAAIGPVTVRMLKAERSILTVLAQYPDGRNKRQLAILAGYAVNGGGFNNALSHLKTLAFVSNGDLFRITEEGLSALGEWTPLPTGSDLVDYWMRNLARAERSILSVLVDVYPDALDVSSLAERAGYTPGTGGFNNALSRLRTLELVEGRRECKASATLFDA